MVTLALVLRVCAAAPPGATRLGVGIAMSVVLIGLSMFAIRALWLVLCHMDLLRKLDRSSHRRNVGGGTVYIIEGHGGPFVAGLWRPRVFCAKQTLSRLTSSEVRAVLAHEEWHQRCYAPLQLMLLAAAWPMSLLPLTSRHFDGWRAQLEIDADRHAIRTGIDPSQLASALLTIGDEPGATGRAHFAATSELRIRALLGESQPEASGRSGIKTALLVTAFAIACFAM